jgi:hypothetical protein
MSSRQSGITDCGVACGDDIIAGGPELWNPALAR